MTPLSFRLAVAADHPKIEEMVIASFEPITWFKKLDARIGPLNGMDWRSRWQDRLRNVFATEIILVGETEGQLAAMSSGTVNPGPALAYIDLLAVDRRMQGRGYGRDMLRAMIQHMKGLGAQFVYLNCLTDNDVGNALYRAEGFENVGAEIHWFRKIP
jgi:ribosomal protein S18 acetylase RimI-like enzyme